MQYENIYIHVPFCAAKCDYCAFHSTGDWNIELIQAYIERLKLELAAYKENISDDLRSVYIGGGTPTVLPSRLLEKLLSLVPGGKNTEFSIECNPETLDAEKAQIIAQYANRVSLGAQSFKQLLLDTLGRRAVVANTAQAVQLLADCKVDNLNIDLIYGIPSQSPGDWRDDLNAATAGNVKHMSAYALGIEEPAKFAGDGIKPADESLLLEMYNTAETVLAARGFEHYEISNYALEGFKCCHNLNVWGGRTYLGAGAAAVSFDGRQRRSNGELTGYMDGVEPVVDIVDAKVRCREIFAIGLRCFDNWRRKQFDSLDILHHCDYDFDCFLNSESVNTLADEGFLKVCDDFITLSGKGRLFHDHIAEKIIFP